MCYVKRKFFLIYILFFWWRWSTNASKVDGKRSPHKFFLVNILYCNSVTLGPDLFCSWSNSRWTKESKGNCRIRSYLSVPSLLFNVCNAVIFLICEKLLTKSHPACIAGSKQHIGASEVWKTTLKFLEM